MRWSQFQCCDSYEGVNNQSCTCARWKHWAKKQKNCISVFATKRVFSPLPSCMLLTALSTLLPYVWKSTKTIQPKLFKHGSLHLYALAGRRAGAPRGDPKLEGTGLWVLHSVCCNNCVGENRLRPQMCLSLGFWKCFLLLLLLESQCQCLWKLML